MRKKIQASPISEYLKKLGPAGSMGNDGVCAAKITIAKQPVLRGSAYSGMLFNGQGRPINPNGYANTLTASMGGSRTPIIDEAEVFDKKPSWIENFYNALRSGEASQPASHLAPRPPRARPDLCLARLRQATPGDGTHCRGARRRTPRSAPPRRAGANRRRGRARVPGRTARSRRNLRLTL